MCFIFQGKGSSGKGFILKFILLRMHGNLTRLGFLSSRSQWNRKVFLPLTANIFNMLFISIHFSLEKVAFINSSCFVLFDLNKFAYVRWNVIREETGTFFANFEYFVIVIFLFAWAGWSFGSYSADVDLLYPPTHMLTENSHNTGNFIPYSSRIVRGFFNVPQETNEQGRYLWHRAYGLWTLLNHETVKQLNNETAKRNTKHHVWPHNTLNTNWQRLDLRLNIVVGLITPKTLLLLIHWG